MAFSLNRAQIIGNVTRDPEVRVAGGQKVATFGVATNFVWTDQAGQRKEKAEFHNVVAWRRLAEICEQYLKKGSKIYVEGRMQTRDWEGEDGVKRYRTEIVADNLIMLNRKGEETGGSFGDGEKTFTKMPREQRAVKEPAKEVTKEPAKESTGKTEEEEISIDDLPF